MSSLQPLSQQHHQTDDQIVFEASANAAESVQPGNEQQQPFSSSMLDMPDGNQGPVALSLRNSRH